MDKLGNNTDIKHIVSIFFLMCLWIYLHIASTETVHMSNIKLSINLNCVTFKPMGANICQPSVNRNPCYVMINSCLSLSFHYLCKQYIIMNWSVRIILYDSTLKMKWSSARKNIRIHYLWIFSIWKVKPNLSTQTADLWCNTVSKRKRLTDGKVNQLKYYIISYTEMDILWIFLMWLKYVFLLTLSTAVQLYFCDHTPL